MNTISIIFHILLLLSINNAADTVPVNITVDDAGPDPSTSRFISYKPDKGWKYSANCSNCTATQLDKTQVYMETWHDSTFDPGLGSDTTPNEVRYAEFNFTGVAVYVYCILSNSKEFPSGSSDMVFYVDGEQKGTFVREAPGSPGYIYNHTVFAAPSLEDGEHKLLIQNGHQGGKKVLTLLDRIVYTQNRKVEANTTSTSTPQPTGDEKEQGIQGTQTEAGQDDRDNTMNLGAILGGVLGGLGFFLIIGFGWLFWRRRNRSNQNVWQQWPSGIAGDSVHPVDPPVYNEISDEGSVGRSFTNGTMTPFMGEAPTAGTWPSSRKGLARGHVLQPSSTGS